MLVCAKCGLKRTAEGHDPCIANLPGVRHACCGHGAHNGYIYFENGILINGQFDELKYDPEFDEPWEIAGCFEIAYLPGGFGTSRDGGWVEEKQAPQPEYPNSIMNPLIPILLNSALSMIESALEAEGPQVLFYFEAELAKLKYKYATEDSLKAQ